MPRSPSRKQMELLVEAVFMNAGSSVTSPVFARRLEMSTPFSASVPSTTSSSRSCLPTLPVIIRTVSGTASLLGRVACALALSRAAAKESSTEAPEQFAQRGGRVADIIGGSQRRTFSQAPGDGADA